MLLGPLAVLASKVTRVSVSEHGESREIVFSLVENKSAQVSQDDQWTVAGPDAALAYVVLTDVLLHLPFVDDLWEGLTELGTTENDVCTTFFLEDVKDTLRDHVNKAIRTFDPWIHTTGMRAFRPV